jgi:hypothetical protein
MKPITNAQSHNGDHGPNHDALNSQHGHPGFFQYICNEGKVAQALAIED